MTLALPDGATRPASLKTVTLIAVPAAPPEVTADFYTAKSDHNPSANGPANRPLATHVAKRAARMSAKLDGVRLRGQKRAY